MIVYYIISIQEMTSLGYIAYSPKKENSNQQQDNNVLGIFRDHCLTTVQAPKVGFPIRKSPSFSMGRFISLQKRQTEVGRIREVN